MYLIWWLDTTAKGAKKNTSPNVIHLQYIDLINLNFLLEFVPITHQRACVVSFPMHVHV